MAREPLNHPYQQDTPATQTLREGISEPPSPFDFTPAQRALVRLMAGIMPRWQLRLLVQGFDGLPIDERTLRENFMQEMIEGETQTNAAVIGALFRNAVINDNVSAQMFWAKARMGWRETDRLEITGKDGRAIELNQQRMDLTLLSDGELTAFQTLIAKLTASKLADDGSPPPFEQMKTVTRENDRLENHPPPPLRRQYRQPPAKILPPQSAQPSLPDFDAMELEHTALRRSRAKNIPEHRASEPDDDLAS